ncbi:MAG: ATP-dependent helicase [Clostridium sp.]
MNLDKYQREAVSAKDKNILVVAAPGSGKTTVIVNRIKYLMDNLNIPNRNIIVITFTRAAAMNMKERFGGRIAPFFGTFHSLFYKILLREKRNVKIVESFMVHRIVESIVKKYSDVVNEDKVKEVINNISRFKTSIVSLEEFEPTVSNDVFTEALRSYQMYLEKEGVMDFDDLALEVLKLFQNQEKLKEYREIFKYMLVDEFQDCDELQVQFLKLINGNGENSLFAVGDEDQCIYSFRGSKPEYMVSFSNIFRAGKKYYLSMNYRSLTNIVNTSIKVIENNKQRNTKEIKSYRGGEGDVVLCETFDEKTQGEFISKEIKEQVSLGGEYKDNIILYRTNIESTAIIDTLIKENIPFNMLDGEYNFFEHFICKDILNYLKYSFDIFNRELFTSIINKPYRYVSKGSIGYVKGYVEYKNPFDILIDKNDTPPFQRKKLEDLKKEIVMLSRLSLNSAIQYIISDLGYIDYLKDYSERVGSSIEDLEGILEEFKSSASSFRTLPELLAHIEGVKDKLRESKENKEENRVNLATVHRVKGMEFKNVYVVNCNEDNMPHRSAGEENIEEERRIFYVAITRAKDKVYVISPKTQKGKFMSKSRFIKEGEIKEKELEIGAKVGEDIHIKGHGMGKIIEVKRDVIKVIFDGQMERSFSYTVLNQNGLIIK